MINLTIKYLPLSMNVDEASEYVGSPQLFRDMRKAGWVKPFVEKHKMTLFDRSMLEKAYARCVAGEVPEV